MFQLPFLNDTLIFPPVENAHESGLLAAGGDLSVHRLILAYSLGIFPWFDENDPYLWWSPDPRFVLFVDDFTLSKRQERAIRKAQFIITANKSFNKVIEYCAKIPRHTKMKAQNEVQNEVQDDVQKGVQNEVQNNTQTLTQNDTQNTTQSTTQNTTQSTTWITNDMIEAYKELHEEGFAHSIEVWQNNNLDIYKNNTLDNQIHANHIFQKNTYLNNSLLNTYSQNHNNYPENHDFLKNIDLNNYSQNHNFLEQNNQNNAFYENHRLVGGLYGVRMGQIFCGESMFHLVPEASRAALAYLVSAMKKNNMPLIDSQQKTEHMARLGAKEIPRKDFLHILRKGLQTQGTGHERNFLR